MSIHCGYLGYTLLLKGHPHLEKWKAIGRQYTQKMHGLLSDPPDPPQQKHAGPVVPSVHDAPNGPKLKTCRAQVVRSVCDWSHGVLTEHSIQDACESFAILIMFEDSNSCLDIQLIRESNHYIYIGMFIPVPSFLS